MKKTIFGLTATAIVSVLAAACAVAPVDTDPQQAPEAQGEPAKAVSGNEGTAATEKPDLAKGGLGDMCGVECSSGDGSQTCCCGVGEKCVSYVAWCECKSAYLPVLGSGGIRSID